MLGLKAKNTYYSGKDCHRYVERLISGGMELYIVSPYIDEYYAKFLKSHSYKKKVRIISSSIKKDARKELGLRAPISALIKVALIATILDLLLFFFYVLPETLLFLSILFIITSALFIANLRYDIAIKTPRDFTHAKLYISENMAIQGSANLTYRGMHANVEHIEILYNEESIDELRNEFLRMWKNLS